MLLCFFFMFLFQSFYDTPAYIPLASERNNVQIYAELGGGRVGALESVSESHYREALISDIYDDVVDIKGMTKQCVKYREQQSTRLLLKS